MSFNGCEDEKRSALMPWEGRAAIAQEGKPASDSEQQARSFAKTMLHLWKLVRGYTADDIARLKEAGVRQVEAKAAKDFAEAEEKIANAAKAHAEAEAIRAKAACDLLTAKLEAVERVEAAISRIKQKGGAVAFSEDELRAIVLRTGEKYPGDAALKDPEKHVESVRVAT